MKFPKYDEQSHFCSWKFRNSLATVWHGVAVIPNRNLCDDFRSRQTRGQHDINK